MAGLRLAVHTWTIKYVSQIMLESIPAFTSLVSVLSYELWKKKKKGNRVNSWLVTSAIFLGITAASKYLFAVIGIAILVDWLIETREAGKWKKPLRNMVIWGLIAIAIFFVFDPYLWPDPIGRLKESILYHTLYSQGAQEVERANYPVWQQLSWLFSSPQMWQTDAFYFSIDPLITIFAFIGLVRTWREKRLFALWLIIGLFFLLIWPTKWPQYLSQSVCRCVIRPQGMDIIIFTPQKNWFANKRSAGAETVVKKNHIKKHPLLIPGDRFLIFTHSRCSIRRRIADGLQQRFAPGRPEWRNLAGVTCGLTGKFRWQSRNSLQVKDVH